MMSYSPALHKLLTICPPVRINGTVVRVIEKGMFTKEEIEALRKEDNAKRRWQKKPLIANFLPDNIRPKWIPKL